MQATNPVHSKTNYLIAVCINVPGRMWTSRILPPTFFYLWYTKYQYTSTGSGPAIYVLAEGWSAQDFPRHLPGSKPPGITGKQASYYTTEDFFIVFFLPLMRRDCPVPNCHPAALRPYSSTGLSRYFIHTNDFPWQWVTLFRTIYIH